MPFDPSFKAGDVTLSNSNYSANTFGGAASWRSVLGDVAFDGSAPIYFEIELPASGSIGSYLSGIATESAVLSSSSGSAFAQNAEGYGYRASTGVITNNETTVGTGPTASNGDTVQFYFDGSNLHIGVNGTWHSGVTPTDGDSANAQVTGITAGTYRIAAGIFRESNAITMVDDDVDYTETMPAGAVSPAGSVKAPSLALPVEILGFDPAPAIPIVLSFLEPPSPAQNIALAFNFRSPDARAPAVDLLFNMLAGRYPAPAIELDIQFRDGTYFAPTIGLTTTFKTPATAIYRLPVELRNDPARHRLYRVYLYKEGLPAYYLPARNIQARLNYSTESYIAVTVAGIEEHQAEIVARTDGIIFVVAVDVVSTGTESINLIAEAELTAVSVYDGVINSSLVLEARRTDANPAPQERTLSAGSYKATVVGAPVIHRSAPDHEIKPGDLVTLFDSTKIIIDSISLTLSPSSQTMEVKDLSTSNLLLEVGEALPATPSVNVTSTSPDTPGVGDYVASRSNTIWTYDDGSVIVQALPWDTAARS